MYVRARWLVVFPIFTAHPSSPANNNWADGTVSRERKRGRRWLGSQGALRHWRWVRPTLANLPFRSDSQQHADRFVPWLTCSKKRYAILAIPTIPEDRFLCFAIERRSKVGASCLAGQPRGRNRSAPGIRRSPSKRCLGTVSAGPGTLSAKPAGIRARGVRTESHREGR